MAWGGGRAYLLGSFQEYARLALLRNSALKVADGLG